ncbi:transmembrane amino acid transporter protein-domain-containing protein [Amylostereum chailletii]|nr:transmembrane amino acid transporter protein-domain-containing protein [Amylostereum chailletii]
MVQPYGAARLAEPREAASERSTLLGGEGSALLEGREPGEGRVKREGHASLTSSVSNLANTIIGSGMLTFPLALASAGIIPGIITCVFSGGVAVFGLYLLTACARKAPHRRALRHTSYIALFSVAYLVIIVMSCYFYPLEDMPEPGEIHLIKFTPAFVSTFPIQVFAFTCAQNIFPIFNEVKGNTQKRMTTIVGTAIGSATFTYLIIAVFGYLTFGSTVGANIIAMYPSTSLFIAFGQLAIAILVMFSYPLQVHPCRNCLDKIFHFGQPEAGVVKPVAGADADEDEEGEVEDEDHAAGEMSVLKHTVLTAAIIASGFTIAFFVDDLQMVLSFVGSTGSTTISFILPGLFYWKMTKDDASASRVLNKAALALAGYGMFILVFCLSFNIYKVVNPDAEPSAH